MNVTHVFTETLSEVQFTTGPSNTSFTNGTDNTTDPHPYEFYMEEQLAFLAFLLIVTVIGNSIVLVAVAVAKNRSRMTFFIMHLAIADLLVGFVSLMPDLLWRLAGHFYGGEVLCKIVKFSQCLVTYGSTFVLVALSIDRLDAIARPLGFSTSKIRNQILVAIAWFIAAVFSVPTAIFFQTDMCMINFSSVWHWRVYLTLITFAVFIIPAIIIAFCYGILVYIIVSKNSALKATVNRKQDRKPLYYNNESKHRRGKISYPAHRLHDSGASSRGIIPKAKIRTIKMTFVIIFVFILCWSPYFVWNLLSVYGLIHENQTTMFITVFVQGLAPLNSALNPVIYGVFSTRICRQLRRFRIVKLFCDNFSICNDKSDRRIQMTDFKSETSTMMTDAYPMRRQNKSPEWSIYNRGDRVQAETCDLIASVQPEKTVV